MDRVLVTCPTARTKDYALDAYLRAYHEFTYPNRELFMVDTSKDEEYADELEAKGVHTARYPCNPIGVTLLVTYVWQDVLFPYVKEHGFDWVLSLESDTVCPPNTIEFLLDAAERYQASVVALSYPHREHDDHEKALNDKRIRLEPGRLPLRIHRGLGCTLFDPSMFALGESLEDYFEVYLFEKARILGRGVIVMDHILEIEHLD
jgi:hypothetical protein